MTSEPRDAARNASARPWKLRRGLQRILPMLAARPAGVVAVTLVVAMGTGFAVLAIPGDTHRPAHTVSVSAFRRQVISRSETTQILQRERGAAAKLPRAKAAPPALQSAAADSPPLAPEAEFGFAPYWTLGQTTTFDVPQLKTIAYFALDVNGDGTIAESGTGWDGYESQALANLVARAHAAGDRVVLTVSCFAQSALDQLTSSASAAATLAGQVVADIQAKHLDGVNLDLEGEGSADQAGLTQLVATVARAVRAADPHDQVTMDTYASSAGDPRGFYDIPALSHVVDGFFVMDYDLNLDGQPADGSALTSTEFPDALAAEQYAAAVPARMVILGASFFGYQWPTSNGTLDASATGPASPVSYAQAVSDGAPLYWDRVTQTAWSSFERGGQWYETYFEDPESIYLLSALAHHYGFGTGVWALGMQGGDQRMLGAIDGITPGTGTGPTGPSSTSSSTAHPAVAAGAPSPGKSSGKKGSGARRSTTRTTRKRTTGHSSSSTTTTTTTTFPSPLPTTTTTAPKSTTTTTGASPDYNYSGVVQSKTVTLRKVTKSAMPAGTPIFVGTLSSFSTDDPSVACLEHTPAPINVWRFMDSSNDVVTARSPGSCATATFEFPASALSAQGTSNSF